MKKVWVLLLALVMCVSMTACIVTPGGKDNKEDKAEVENDTSDKTEETDSDDADVETEDDANAETEEENNEVEDTTPVLVAGELQSIENTCEFSLDYVNIASKVEPPQLGSFYSYYEAENGKVYVDICIAYKNLQSSDIEADEVLTGTLIYAGKYEYSGFAIIEEDNRSDFTYANITSIAPLSTEYLHYLFEVPADVQTSGGSVEVILAVGTKPYKIIVADGSTEIGTDTGNATGKTSGAVVQGEVITTGNAEFSVDYSNITNKVEPPQPGSFYSYYEAESGKVYVDICFAYKNLTGSDAAADEVISAKLKYAGKYDYTGFSMIEEDNRGDFTYSNITSIAPLNTEYVHYLFEVPEEVASSSESVEITFFVDGNEYTYTVR